MQDEVLPQWSETQTRVRSCGASWVTVKDWGVTPNRIESLWRVLSIGKWYDLQFTSLFQFLGQDYIMCVLEVGRGEVEDNLESCSHDQDESWWGFGWSQ